jgi:hypothetical protein
MEPGGNEIFRILPDWPWVLLSLPYNVYLVFPGGKVMGRGVDNPPLSNAEVKKE